WRTVTVAAAAGRLIALRATGPALGGGAATAATGRAGTTAVSAPDGAANAIRMEGIRPRTRCCMPPIPLRWGAGLPRISEMPSMTVEVVKAAQAIQLMSRTAPRNRVPLSRRQIGRANV